MHLPSVHCTPGAPRVSSGAFEKIDRNRNGWVELSEISAASLSGGLNLTAVKAAGVREEQAAE